MKEPINVKFENIPFIVPTEKRVENKLASLVKELKECGSARTADLAIRHWNKYITELDTQMTVIYIRYSIDTTNKAYKKAQDKMDELSPMITKYSIEFMKTLTKARYRKDLEAKYGKYLFKMYDNSIKTFDESIMPESIEENKLVSQYNEILGGAKIEFRGETYNLSQLGKLTSDSDRETRKEASIALDKWIGEHNEEIGEIYDKLVHLRDNMAKKLGFKNYVELGYLRMGRTDYNAKMVKQYRDQITQEVTPLCQKLYKEQAKRIKVKNPQYYDYNVMFLDGNPKPIGDSKYLVDMATKMYDDMSPETSVFFHKMLDLHMMDLEAKPGKTPGGYECFLPYYKMPFVFSNFNGTSGDVDVLTHEMGHAFQSYVSADIKVPEYQSPTMETCEIHSMSMEFLAWPYMESFFGDQANKYRYFHLVSAIEFLPYGITVDEFQHWVYEHPNATHEQRCAKWREIEIKNTPHKVYDDTPNLAKGEYWLRQSHIFGSPFYYIDYTLSQVVAFQFLAESRKNKEKTWKKYVKLCKCGGKYPFKETLEKNHLRCPFDEGNVAKAVRPLTKILKQYDPKNY